MAVTTCKSYAEMKEHVGHKLECVTYAGSEEVAIECRTCFGVLCRVEED